MVIGSHRHPETKSIVLALTQDGLTKPCVRVPADKLDVYALAGLAPDVLAPYAEFLPHFFLDEIGTSKLEFLIRSRWLIRASINTAFRQWLRRDLNNGALKSLTRPASYTARLPDGKLKRLFA